MIKLPKKQRASSVLGLSLDGNRLEGVVLRRANGSLVVQKTISASLSLDPLTNDPELVGREIQNHLEKAGIRERRCAVCVPLNWVLTLQTKLPDLPAADVSEGAPKIRYRQDLTRLGWALGQTTRQRLLLAKELR